MKRKAILACAAILALTSVTVLAGCGDMLNNAESTVNNTISNVTSALENNPVTSIYNQINEKETQYDSKKLENVLKDFYSGVISGTINEDTAGYLVTEALPAANSPTHTKKKAANELTVLSAIEQQGMQALYTDEYLSNFMYGNSKIVYKGSVSANEFNGPITLDTKLGDIFAN